MVKINVHIKYADNGAILKSTVRVDDGHAHTYENARLVTTSNSVCVEDRKVGDTLVEYVNAPTVIYYHRTYEAQ